MRAMSTGARSLAADRRNWLAIAFIVLVTCLAFFPALQNGFVTWDDDLNFLDNHRYRGLGLEQLQWMWTTFHLGHYVPLTWMTLGLDYVIWGMNPAGYHFTNVLLHAANAVLLYVLALRILAYTQAFRANPNPRMLTIAAAFAALLFAIHPLRVESVAWVTERRDMLSLFFYLLCVLFYMRSVEENAPRRWLALSIAMFLFALLSKATSMTLPGVLLIMNVFRFRRLGGTAGWWNPGARRVYLEILPFAVLSAATAVMSIVALKPPDQLTLSGKIAVSSYSLAFYLWKTLVPVRLSPLYEMPTTVDPGAPMFVVSYAVVIGVTGLALALRRRVPDIAAGWLVFIAILLPMLGLVQNGPQIAADRYTYHAAPVLAVMVAALLALVLRRSRTLPLAIGAIMLAMLGTLTWRQTQVWRDGHSLWSHVVRLDPESSMGHAGLGNLLLRQGRLSDATEHLEKSVSFNPRYEEGHNNLGIALARQGRFDEAITHFEHALAIRIEYAEPHSNWGMALAAKGDVDGAMQHYQRALEIEPDLADAHTNLGNLLVRTGKAADAIPHYERALALRPDHADAQLNWGVALVQQGNISGAIDRFRQALAIQPDHPEAREYLQRASQLRKP
ncbi:MAG TPA: tetratricopeptide repeat protein [Gemmatimonadaceae bacterium]|nr:tetratricopeptide repeat protein [Gemmatimonadaceae bacterium]